MRRVSYARYAIIPLAATLLILSLAVPATYATGARPIRVAFGGACTTVNRENGAQLTVGAVLSGEVPIGAPPGPIQVSGYALVVIETSPVASAVVSISGVLTPPSGGSPDYTLDFHLLGTVTSPAPGGNLGPGSMVFASFTNPGLVSFALTNQGAVQICSFSTSSGLVAIG